MFFKKELRVRTGWITKALSVIIAGAMIFNMTSVRAFAEEKAGSGKYVSDVFIAYGKTEEEAAAWLKDNGWEYVKGDFNAGKASFWDDSAGHRDNVAAVMGIKRSDDKKDAITDMAVMNMTGGYSEPDYKELLSQKKKEIEEFVNGFMVVIEEYRDNYNSDSSTFGAKRAQFTHDLLNTFIDGDPEAPDAVNDTKLPLGDLLLEKSRQEGNDKGGDLEQMILEGSGAAMIAVETLLVLASDTGEESWIERASGLTGDELSENLPNYVPEAAGQDIAPSAIEQYLGQKYGETAEIMAKQWEEIHDDMLWYEDYNEKNDLWPHDDESKEDHIARIDAFLEDLGKSEDLEKQEEASRYTRILPVYYGIYEVSYEGGWGETLGDFFNPADDEWLYPAPEFFLPMAAALSNGQRAGLDFLSLETLILMGLGSEEAFKKAAPEIKKLIGDNEEYDLYTGVNRAAFRGGTAITNETLMRQNEGKGNAFEGLWGNTGIVAIICYSSAVVGAALLGTGIYMTITNETLPTYSAKEVQDCIKYANEASNEFHTAAQNYHYKYGVEYDVSNNLDFFEKQSEYNFARDNLENVQAGNDPSAGSQASYVNRWLMGVGGALLVAAAVVSAVRLWKYYDRDMKPIPRMIVDESDIVTYLKDENGKPLLDENGKQKKNIDFKTYEYYSAVRCNRPDVGEIGDWNSGVKEYKDHNCYDIADLNCDMGQEWIALYAVKSRDKGNPILADSLTLQYGKDASMPKGCTQALHLFTYTTAVDLGDTAWAYNNDKKGVRLYWGEDKTAFADKTASVFSGGHLALAGIAGLIIGIIGATAALRPKRRKQQSAAAQNETTA